MTTVPPTVALCREHFGPHRTTAVLGWVFAARMIGAGAGALAAGPARQSSGSYQTAWITAASATRMSLLLLDVDLVDLCSFIRTP